MIVSYTEAVKLMDFVRMVYIGTILPWIEVASYYSHRFGVKGKVLYLKGKVAPTMLRYSACPILLSTDENLLPNSGIETMSFPYNSVRYPLQWTWGSSDSLLSVSYCIIINWLYSHIVIASTTHQKRVWIGLVLITDR